MSKTPDSGGQNRSDIEQFVSHVKERDLAQLASRQFGVVQHSVHKFSSPVAYGSEAPTEKEPNDDQVQIAHIRRVMTTVCNWKEWLQVSVRDRLHLLNNATEAEFEDLLQVTYTNLTKSPLIPTGIQIAILFSYHESDPEQPYNLRFENRLKALEDSLSMVINEARKQLQSFTGNPLTAPMTQCFAVPPRSVGTYVVGV